MTHKNRVVVTGFSVCASNGIGVKAFEENTLNGISGCHELNAFPINKKFSKVAGYNSAFYPETFFDYNNIEQFDDNYKDRQYLLAEHCIQESLRISKLEEMLKQKNNGISLFLSSAIGPMISMEYAFIHKNLNKKIIPKSKNWIFSFANYTKLLFKTFNFSGSYLSLPTGCVGGCDAVSYGINAIRNNKTQIAIVGASEAPITPLVVSAFGRINATSARNCPPEEASCPFDYNRDGFVLSEGSGIIILESETHALKRQAPIFAEIKGSGSINNCYHMTDISSDGRYINESCKLALNDADITTESIDYVNVHGSSTPQNDVAEANALCDLFGTHIDNIPVTSIKSQTGHALAAANAIEVVSIIQSLKNQKIPPTINVKEQDKTCRVSVVKDRFLPHRIKNVLKTSSGFSGIHTALVIGEY